MITKKTVALFMATVCMNTMQGMNVSEIAEDVGIGTTAGIIEVTANQPLITIKNALQMRLVEVKKAKEMGVTPPPFKVKKLLTRKILYNGYSMNTGCMGPTTAAQFGANKGLEYFIPGDTTIARAERALGAGAISALFAAPAELVVLTQYNTKQAALAAIKQLHQEAGARVWVRAVPIMAVREGLFTYGYMEAFPKVKQATQEQLHTPNWLTIGIAGALTGSVTAIATHPADTIKTVMQSDYERKKYPHIGAAIKGIYQANGIKGFYTAVAPRAIRAGLAIPMVNGIMNVLKDQLNDKK